jgi:acyl-CoA thioesterase
VHSPSAGAARGFAQGQLFCADGTLAVSVAQEGLVRVID